MLGQISLFDLDNQYNDDFETATAKDAARYILDHLGLRFNKTAQESRFKTKIKNTEIEICFSNFTPEVNDGRRFLDIGWTDGSAGGGSPCDSWEMAIDRLRTIMDRANGYCTKSHHICNKQQLWAVAQSLDNVFCPRVCCSKCSDKTCGARCNGA